MAEPQEDSAPSDTLTLYDGLDFDGASFETSDTDSFFDTFNDKAESVKITGQFCLYE